jgi:hypothetical protein
MAETQENNYAEGGGGEDIGKRNRGRGRSFLNKDFFLILQLIQEKKCYFISTNGVSVSLHLRCHSVHFDGA